MIQTSLIHYYTFQIQDEDHEVDVIEGLEDGEQEGSEHDDIAEVQEGAHEESESDSDSNPDDSSYQSNADNNGNQRSSTAGNAPGSEVGAAYFSDDESGDSSNGEDEEESDGALTEPDHEDLPFIDEAIERRNNPNSSSSNVGTSSSTTGPSTSQGVRNNLAQHLQWALRQREINSVTNPSASTPGGRIPITAMPNSTGLVHIDTSSIQRRATSSVAQLQSTACSGEVVSMATTAVSLARAFSIVIRQLAALLTSLHNGGMDRQGFVLGVNAMSMSYSETVSIFNFIEHRLKQTWDWLINIMDATESQLRFGCSLSNNSKTAIGLSPSIGGHAPHTSRGISSSRREDSSRSLMTDSRAGSNSRRNAVSTSNSRIPGSSALESGVARKDFLSYAMSLMRSHNNEHSDSMPVLDVSSLKHIAYVFDAMIYYMRAGNESSLTGKNSDSAGDWSGDYENDSEDLDEDSVTMQTNPMDDDSLLTSNASQANRGRKQRFFQRTNSTLFLGCPPPDPFASPLAEALPLADQPQLLQPTARKEDLFGVPRPTWNTSGDETILWDSLPSRMSLSERTLVDTYPYMPGTKWRSSDPQNVMNVAVSGTVFNDNPIDLDSPFINLSLRSRSVITEPTPSRSPIIVSPNRTSNKSSVIVHAASIKSSNSSIPSGLGNLSGGLRGNSEDNSERNVKEGEALSRSISLIGNLVQHDILLGRWRLTLELFGRIFVDDVGTEPHSVIRELGGFPVKEAKFRKEMEKLRTSHQRDLTFSKLDRERSALIQQTFRELNSMFSNISRRLTAGSPLLAVSRVKVTFKDEPGEGSGVARSFYTAFAEAILSNDKLPPLEGCAGGGRPMQLNLLQRLKSKEREREQQRRAYQNHRSSSSRDLVSNPRDRSDRDGSFQMRYDAPPFIPNESQPSNQSQSLQVPQSGHGSSSGGSGIGGPSSGSLNLNELILSSSASSARQQLGQRLYQRVVLLRPALAPRITGMLLELPTTLIGALLQSDEALRGKVDEAVELLLLHGQGSSSSSDHPLELDLYNPSRSSSSNSKSNTLGLSSKPGGSQQTGQGTVDDEDEGEDNAPLFYQPGKRGFYSPRQGKATAERRNAFRNVGRILGLCLLQNDLCPIYLNRHVIKFILKRSISWHDLAFFDPVLYESLRQLIVQAETDKDADALFTSLDLRFSIDVCPEEGSGHVDLIPNGRNVEVTPSNVYDYVRKYAMYRMYHCQKIALQVSS